MKTHATAKVQNNLVRRQSTSSASNRKTTRQKPAVKSGNRSASRTAPDKVSIGNGNPHQAQFDDAERLRKMSTQSGQPALGKDTGTGVDDGPKVFDPAKGPDNTRASGGGTEKGPGSEPLDSPPEPTSRAPVGETPSNTRTGGEINLLPDDLNPDIKRDNYFSRDPVDMKAETGKGRVDLDDVPGATTRGLPEADGKVSRKLNTKRAFAVFGLWNNTARVGEGLGEISNGNTLEGGLMVTANGLEGYANASDLNTANKSLQNYKNGVQIAEEGAELGLKGAKILGKLAGGAMALYDGKQAFDAFSSGDAVKGTEHGMDAVWDVAGMSGVGSVGALAHVVTRSAMSYEIGGTSGDELVTSGIDSVVNSGVNEQAQTRSKNDSKALQNYRHVGGGGRVKAAAHNREAFARALTGLQEKIGSTEDSGERQNLIEELRSMKSVQRNVRGYSLRNGV